MIAFDNPAPLIENYKFEYRYGQMLASIPEDHLFLVSFFIILSFSPFSSLGLFCFPSLSYSYFLFDSKDTCSTLDVQQQEDFTKIN